MVTSKNPLFPNINYCCDVNVYFKCPGPFLNMEGESFTVKLK